MAKQLTKQTIGVGVAGTGFIGPAHVEGLRRNGIQVLGLAKILLRMPAQKAAELGIPRAYDTFEAMLADPDIDVVHLATPNVLHYPYAKAALLAGKHVVCEKPLAMTAAESAELVKLAAETGRVNAINFNIRMYPMVQQARSLVQSGEIGDLFILQGSYLQDWLLFSTDWNWRLEPGLGGTLRAVGDIGSHWLDLMTFITGLRVEEVYADFKTFHPVRKKPTQTGGNLHRKIAAIRLIISTSRFIPKTMPRSCCTTKTACAAWSLWRRSVQGARTGCSLKSTAPNPRWPGMANAPMSCGLEIAPRPTRLC